MIEPLRLSFTVRASRDHAFDTWTRQIGHWWPRDHSVSGDPELEVLLECRVGGRLYERTADGSEREWGEVTVWDPTTRFGYLWHLRRDREDATDVLLTFEQATDGTTRVDIEHTGWERLGSGGGDWRERNFGGWSTLLPHFQRAVEPAEAAPDA